MNAKVNNMDISIGRLIQKQRVRLGVTQKSLATKIGLTSPVFVSLIEGGKSKLPPRMAWLIALELEIPIKLLTMMLVGSAEIDTERAIESGEKFAKARSSKTPVIRRSRKKAYKKPARGEWTLTRNAPL